MVPGPLRHGYLRFDLVPYSALRRAGAWPHSRSSSPIPGGREVARYLHRDETASVLSSRCISLSSGERAMCLIAAIRALVQRIGRREVEKSNLRRHLAGLLGKGLYGRFSPFDAGQAERSVTQGSDF